MSTELISRKQEELHYHPLSHLIENKYIIDQPEIEILIEPKIQTTTEQSVTIIKPNDLPSSSILLSIIQAMQFSLKLALED